MAKTNTPITSKFTGPHMQATNPITSKPWSPQEQATVNTLNTLADKFYAAIGDDDYSTAQDVLDQRDDILAQQADPAVRAAFALASLSHMTQGAVVND